MSETNKELAAILTGISEWPLLKTEPIFEHEREALREAASRLEARGEITEAMAIRAFQVFDQHQGSAIEAMRAALEVAQKGETP